MRKILTFLEKLAPTWVTITLLGETGVGKTWLARALHEESGVKGDFVDVDCPGISETLFESELFGHVKGAFTGAEKDRAGMLALAKDGTLFLDEIGDVPLAMQAKLLKALEQGEHRPVGADRPVQSRFRLIVATNRDLARRVEEGTFRADLYSRLGRARVVVPPLRERRDDIPALAMAFLAEVCRERCRKCEGFESRALDALVRCPWPSNVRELRSVIELATATCESSFIRLADLSPHLTERSPIQSAPAAAPSPTKVLPWELARAQFDRYYWSQVLTAAGGSRKRAAALAEVSERALYSRLRKFHLLAKLNERAESARSFSPEVQCRTRRRTGDDVEAVQKERPSVV